MMYDKHFMFSKENELITEQNEQIVHYKIQCLCSRVYLMEMEFSLVRQNKWQKYSFVYLQKANKSKHPVICVQCVIASGPYYSIE